MFCNSVVVMSSTNAKLLACFGVSAFVLWLFYSCKSRIFIQVVDEDDHQDPEFRFASYYQNEMVLQAAPHRSIVWGYGVIGAKVEVQFNVYTTYNTIVKESIDGQGVWSVTLVSQPAGTRGIVSASHLYKGKFEIYSIEDVVFGDVWFCSGQSNMAFPLGHMFNATEELKIVENYPDIQFLSVSQVESDSPLYDLKVIRENWTKPTADKAQFFSAVCWLYGRNIYDKMKIPIGLIGSDWDGTPVEAWSPPQALASCGLNKSRQDSLYFRYPSESSVLWNAMVHPFLNMTIKGGVWYQGEANAFRNTNLYNCTFPAMIKEWRRSWYEATNKETDETFPFGFVQLSTETLPSENGKFPLLRWHQTGDFGYTPNILMPATFMAVAMDLPDPDSPYGSIHPRDKQDVGIRLSSGALTYVYEYQEPKDGPFPISASKNGANVYIVYSTYLKLNVDVPTNFEICCSERICDVSDLTPEGFAEWHPAKLFSYSDKSLQVANDYCVQSPKMVRYAWSTVPCSFKKCQVYNSYGFPAPPFVMDISVK